MNLREKMHLSSVELLVLFFFFFFSLRVVNWFEYPYVLISGDFRPILVVGAFANRTFYTWDEFDLGMPSVYMPRILDPAYFFMFLFRTYGMDLYSSEMISVFLLYFISSILMYVFVKQLTNKDVIAALIAAFFLTSNVYLVNDREVTAIYFVDIFILILPSLIFFVEGIKRRSNSLMAISGMLTVFTHATFPNYRTTLTLLMTLVIVLLFLFIKKRLQLSIHYIEENKISLKIDFPTGFLRPYLKLFLVFFLVFMTISFWIFMIVFFNYGILIEAYEKVYSSILATQLDLNNVIRLIARWGFYSGTLSRKYVPYADAYTSDPIMIFLCYLPAILAFTSILLYKDRKLTVYFGLIAIASLLLTAGLFYSNIIQIPFLKVFREAANWIYFAILSFSILLGCSTSAIFRRIKNRFLGALAICLVFTLFVYTAFPLATGDVSRNWLDPSIRGSYFPSSYLEANDLLDSNYWTLLAPSRMPYVVYNFSGFLFGSGNPYPLIFSKPTIAGTGTEYIGSANSELISRIYDAILNTKSVSIESEGKVSASSTQKDGLEPIKAIDSQENTRWASGLGLPQWFQIEWNKTRSLSNIKILFESAYAEDYEIQKWNGTSWVSFFFIKDNNSTLNVHNFQEPNEITRLRLLFTKASSFNMVSIWEIKIYDVNVNNFIGFLGIKHVVLEKDFIFGNNFSPNSFEGNGLFLVKKWEEIELFRNMHVQEKVYAANKIIYYEDLDDFCQIINKTEWSVLETAVLTENSSNQTHAKKLESPKNFIWTQIDPTKYEARIESKGSFMLVLLESYDANWKVYVNGRLLPETNHFRVNEYANGWLIDEVGDINLTVCYEVQNTLRMSIAFSLISSIVLITIFTFWKKIKPLTQKIHH